MAVSKGLEEECGPHRLAPGTPAKGKARGWLSKDKGKTLVTLPKRLPEILLADTPETK